MMSEFKMPFAEGAFINKPPMFGGVNYAFWKIRMKIFMEFFYMGIWDAVVSGPFYTHAGCQRRNSKEALV